MLVCLLLYRQWWL